LTTAVGVQGGHQELTAPSPDGIGLWDPNSNWRVAGYIFNEIKFSEATKAQIAGRIEQVSLSGFGRSFDASGLVASTPASPSYTPKSVSVGLIQKLPWNLVGSVTAQYIERAPKPAELFSGGPHDATATFDKGNPDLKIEAAQSVEVGLRRTTGSFRFEATAYYTRFNGFIFRQLTGIPATIAAYVVRGLASSTRRFIRRPMPSSAGANFRANGTLCLWPAGFSASKPVRCRPRNFHQRYQCATYPAGACRRRRLLAQRRMARARPADSCFRAKRHCALGKHRRRAMTICARRSATPGSPPTAAGPAG
jgi:hypothetical protein